MQEKLGNLQESDHADELLRAGVCLDEMMLVFRNNDRQLPELEIQKVEVATQHVDIQGAVEAYQYKEDR